MSPPASDSQGASLAGKARKTLVFRTICRRVAKAKRCCRRVSPVWSLQMDPRFKNSHVATSLDSKIWKLARKSVSILVLAALASTHNQGL